MFPDRGPPEHVLLSAVASFGTTVLEGEQEEVQSARGSSRLGGKERLAVRNMPLQHEQAGNLDAPNVIAKVM